MHRAAVLHGPRFCSLLHAGGQHDDDARSDCVQARADDYGDVRSDCVQARAAFKRSVLPSIQARAAFKRSVLPSIQARAAFKRSVLPSIQARADD